MKITFGRLGMLFFLFLLTSCASTLPLASSGQTEQSPSGEDLTLAAAGASASAKEDAEDDGLPTIASVVEGAARFAGFFDLYQSSDDGAVYLRIPTDNLDQELIYTATVTDGVYTTSSVTALSDVTDAGSGAIITGAERTKLSNIETAADVTDATNVLAAGAVMTSGDQTIAGSKTFSSTIIGDLSGEVITATQPNITSVGTLSTLAVSGDVSLNSSVEISGNLIIA